MSITGGDLSLNQGYLIAGDPDGAHIKIATSLPDPDNPIPCLVAIYTVE